MTFALSAPTAGSVKFLKKFDLDFPETGLPEVRRDSASIKGRSVIEISQKSMVGLKSPDKINEFMIKQLNSLKEIAEKTKFLESQLDPTVNGLDSINPETIRKLEDYLTQKEQLLFNTQACFDKTIFNLVPPSSKAWKIAELKKITIRLVHEPNGENPLLHRRVEVYDPKWYGDSLVAYAMTDKKGKFSFPWSGGDQSLKLCVYEELLPAKGLTSRLGTAVRVVFTQNFIPKINTIQQIKVDLFTYQDKGEGYLPRLKQPPNSSYRPQQESFSYQLALGKAAAVPKMTDGLVSLMGDVSIEKLEELYGVIRPELGLNSKTTVDLLLNGIYPCNFLKTPDRKPGHYFVDINWDAYTLDDPSNILLADVQVYLKDDKTDCLEVYKVSIKFADSPKAVDFLSTDPNFSKALYIANSMALLKGEIVSHLGLGHLYTEQNAMAVYRTIRYNPLGLLLKPHLRGVLEINLRGDDLIFGATGILKLSRLSLSGIKKALQDVLRGVCYTNFRPRTPVNDKHTFAQAEELYWNIVGTAVNQFFDTHIKEIKDYWYEIEAMSTCLNYHSLEHKRWQDKDYDEWISTNEIDQPMPGEKFEEGGSRVGPAVRPIVQFPGEPAHIKDVERLKQFSQHAIFTSTFWHWVVHKSQGVWGTNLKIASLAPRDSNKEPYHDISSSDAAQQLSLAHVFTNFQRGHALDNIHGDINTVLIALLDQNRQRFEDLGFNISDMFGGVFI